MTGARPDRAATPRSAAEDAIDELTWLSSPAAERLGEAERLTRFCALVPIVLVYARARVRYDAAPRIANAPPPSRGGDPIGWLILYLIALGVLTWLLT